MGKTNNAIKDKWNSRNYDGIRVRIPKGHKATVETAAQTAGESVNAYTNRALLDRMGRSEWGEPTPPEDANDKP